MDGPSAPLSDKLGTKTFDSGAAMTMYCYARDYQGQHRKTHKPAPGKYVCADCNIRLAPVEDVLKQGTVVPIAGTWLSKALAYLDSYKKS